MGVIGGLPKPVFNMRSQKYLTYAWILFYLAILAKMSSNLCFRRISCILFFFMYKCFSFFYCNPKSKECTSLRFFSTWVFKYVDRLSLRIYSVLRQGDTIDYCILFLRTFPIFCQQFLVLRPRGTLYLNDLLFFGQIFCPNFGSKGRWCRPKIYTPLQSNACIC